MIFLQLSFSLTFFPLPPGCLKYLHFPLNEGLSAPTLAVERCSLNSLLAARDEPRVLSCMSPFIGGVLL